MLDAKVFQKLANAVLDELNSATLPASIDTAERSYADWELPLDDDAKPGELRLDVVPVNDPTTELEGRGDATFKIATDIVVRKKFGKTDQDDATGHIPIEEIDALTEVVLAIHAHFLKERPTTLPDAVWEKTELRAVYIAKHLREYRQFTGIIRVTFDVSAKL